MLFACKCALNDVSPTTVSLSINTRQQVAGVLTRGDDDVGCDTNLVTLVQCYA